MPTGPPDGSVGDHDSPLPAGRVSAEGLNGEYHRPDEEADDSERHRQEPRYLTHQIEGRIRREEERPDRDRGDDDTPSVRITTHSCVHRIRHDHQDTRTEYRWNDDPERVSEDVIGIEGTDYSEQQTRHHARGIQSCRTQVTPPERVVDGRGHDRTDHRRHGSIECLVGRPPAHLAHYPPSLAADPGVAC